MYGGLGKWSKGNDVDARGTGVSGCGFEGGAGGAVQRRPRVGVITCAVLEEEVGYLVRGMEHVVRVEVLEQGLHNDPPKLRTRLQEAVARVEQDERVEVIALGYGLCSRGSEGVTGGRCRLVMARAHDCITLLLGDKGRYAKYVAEHPGTYWYSPGWNKHHVPPGKRRWHQRY